MQDIRLLTLYKQHYLDRYENALPSHISCIGYYDGLDLEKIDDKKSAISVAPITNLWYATGKKVEGLPGGYSNQNIGLIRCGFPDEQNKYAEQYWEIEKRLPFFSVAFLKLEKWEQYKEISLMIENELFKRKIDLSKETCIALSYTTFDNSDMVLLLKGNDFVKLEEVLNGIEDLDGVKYLHSILGIEDDYLKSCKKSGKVLAEWQETQCFVDKEIKRIEINLAASGVKNVISDVKSELEKWNQDPWGIKGFENITYSYVTGHGNINLMLKETDVRSLVTLLVPGGFSTHQNPVYQCGVYNIETDIFIKEHQLSDVKSIKFSAVEEQAPTLKWCKKMIAKYTKYFSNEFIKADEGLYSCYQALFQTLNALEQYEEFALSKDIFDIIFPSFRMFDGKIEKALEQMKTEKETDSLELLKEAMQQYLECVNSVVYHTIHTEQVYLMIPGYSGTSFSIPIKLKLFYAWYVYKIGELLNDNKKKFSCIIAPIIETRPRTSLIGSDLHNNEKIIHICLSQRTLFQPKYLMIILAHEMGHYIGKDIRLRKERLDGILKIMAYYITEAIFPEEYMEDLLSVGQFNTFSKMKEFLTQKLQGEIQNILIKKRDEKFTDESYYIRDIWEPLMSWSADLFMEEGLGKEISEIIHSIPSNVLSEIEKDKENYVENMRCIARIQKNLDRNRKRASYTGIMPHILKDLITVYQEVFSDIVAVTILKCEREDYINAFCVSEGKHVIDDQGISSMEHEIRQKIMDMVVFGYTGYDEPEQDDKEQEFLQEDGGMSEEDRLYIGLTQFEWVEKSLKDYACACRKKIEERLEDAERSKLVKKIRDVYNLLGESGSECECIFETMSNCIAEYRRMVESEYKEMKL